MYNEPAHELSAESKLMSSDSRLQTPDSRLFAYVSLGSNLGDRAGNLLLGVRGMLEAGFVGRAPVINL